MDSLLKDYKIRGQTMGDRLKNATGLKLNINDAWQVHKIRNKVAHELGFHPSKQDAKLCLSLTSKNLKKLKII